MINLIIVMADALEHRDMPGKWEKRQNMLKMKNNYLQPPKFNLCNNLLKSD